jgi:hypothetical protein
MNTHAAINRILVISNDRPDAAVLARAFESSVASDAERQVLIVAPALNGRFRRWTSDDDEAYEAAEQRLRSCIDDLERLGYSANGMIGEADPLLAAADALRVFRADVLVIATQEESRANWLARNLVTRARERFDVPVVEVVTDAAPQLLPPRSRALAA